MAEEKSPDWVDSLATIPGSLEGLEADWGGSAAQKIKKLSETPTTVSCQIMFY